jgi:hypothetical protein
MSKVVVFTVACISMLWMTAPAAKADAWNQQTTVTFNEPVEVPGQVLTPGTYVFRVLESLSDRNIVEVLNKDETHLYGTFLAIPDYRLKTPGKTIINFEERTAGSPEAVRAWFYPGDNFGHEFVYPRTRAKQLARANGVQVPSMPDELSPDTNNRGKATQNPNVTALKNTQVNVEKPKGEETGR